LLSSGLVEWLPFVITFAFSAVIAGLMIGGQPRGYWAVGCAVLGFMLFYQGFDLARMEEALARYGTVTTGYVDEKFSSLERNGTRYLGPRVAVHHADNPIVTGNGSRLPQGLSRAIATGSIHSWVIDYSYACDGRRCGGREFVSEAMWNRLRTGQTVDVREIEGQPYSSRLEDNPRWAIAAISLGLGTVFLFGARRLSGRPFAWRRDWITAPAVVLRVEPVAYPDATRWRIHFAYFDSEGQARESADEVAANTWKAGDDCLAVFRRKSPDLATMRPYETPGAAA